MPLNGTADQLAEKIVEVIAPSHPEKSRVKEEWTKVCNVIISHVCEQSVVTGNAEGKPLVQGQIT